MAALKLTDNVILAAIQGFEIQKTSIDRQIEELRMMLSGGQTEIAAAPEGFSRKRRTLSASTKRKMAAAQKARYARQRGETVPTSEPTTPELTTSELTTPELTTPEPAKAKRKMSAAGRRAISEATKKRWALKRVADAATSAPAKTARKAGAKRKAVANNRASVKKAGKKSASKKSAAGAAPVVAGD
jgi:hypothetical protein